MGGYCSDGYINISKAVIGRHRPQRDWIGGRLDFKEQYLRFDMRWH